MAKVVLRKISPRPPTKGIAPTESWEVWWNDKQIAYLNKGTEAYFGERLDGSWCTTWYDSKKECVEKIVLKEG